MGNTTSLNLFATCLPQHQAAAEQQQQQKSSFNPTPVDEDQSKTDDWDADFSDHFDEEKKETKSEVKDNPKTNSQTVTNHAQPTEKVANAPMRLEKKDKESTSLKSSKEPTNPTPESSDKTLGEPTSQPSSPKPSPATISPKLQSNQITQDSNTAESQDVDFFSDMTPQYVAPKKIQIQPKPVAQPAQAKIKIDLESANIPENLDVVGWNEEEIQIEEPDVNGEDDNSFTPAKAQPKRERKKKQQNKDSKQKPARLTAVKLKSAESFDDDFEDHTPVDTNS